MVVHVSFLMVAKLKQKKKNITDRPAAITQFTEIQSFDNTTCRAFDNSTYPAKAV